MSKPTKPDRWSRPSDISLKKAMEKAQLESASRLDGTMAISNKVCAFRVKYYTSLYLDPYYIYIYIYILGQWFIRENAKDQWKD
jgi:hypothetical protein